MNVIGRAQLETALAALGELWRLGGCTTRLSSSVAATSSCASSSHVRPPRISTFSARRRRAFGLSDDWLNTGPDSLLDLGLPDGFVERLERRDYGGLIAWLAGWFDMVCFKLYAAVDQGPRSRHFQDFRDLAPRRGDLLAAAQWAMSHDPSPGFRNLPVETLRALNFEDADASLG